MKSDWIDPDKGPTPEQLAAYADGEVAGAERAAIEAWLRHKPASAAEVEAQRRFLQRCRETSPAEPSDVVWSSVLNKIDAGLKALPVAAGKKSPWTPRLGCGAAAAAVLALVLLGKSNQSPAPLEESFQVIAASDVAILSINGTIRAAFVVAEPPVGLIGAGRTGDADRRDAREFHPTRRWDFRVSALPGKRADDNCRVAQSGTQAVIDGKEDLMLPCKPLHTRWLV